MTMLPSEFADLEPYAPIWCLPSERERYAQRLASTMADMQRFYDAITARAEDVFTYCDKFPLDELPEEVQNLLYLLYSMITVSFPVEVWSQPKVPDTGVAALDCVIEPVP
ncbi:hypothetical protein J2W56_000749 [Nocardia kruczakiae]|uniref:Xaa-Pro dipeptidase n=1 Tax=Nocardia kruczakiae TaxID=261477 RepID=A0ABU1X921_9NOCA|nr:hypothetical protein [Nocardia kruczakiae]MDR7167031.1 hypothetical protein [Nocardia kruczakiae]